MRRCARATVDDPDGVAGTIAHDRGRGYGHDVLHVRTRRSATALMPGQGAGAGCHRQASPCSPSVTRYATPPRLDGVAETSIVVTVAV